MSGTYVNRKSLKYLWMQGFGKKKKFNKTINIKEIQVCEVL